MHTKSTLCVCDNLKKNVMGLENLSISRVYNRRILDNATVAGMD